VVVLPDIIMLVVLVLLVAITAGLLRLCGRLEG